MIILLIYLFIFETGFPDLSIEWKKEKKKRKKKKKQTKKEKNMTAPRYDGMKVYYR